MITFYLDEITPCLKDVKTGGIVDTEVVRIRRKSFLSKFNKKTGWYVNWGRMPNDVEIYALVLKGTMDIQGLIAIKNDEDAMDEELLEHYCMNFKHGECHYMDILFILL